MGNKEYYKNNKNKYKILDCDLVLIGLINKKDDVYKEC